MLTDAGYGPDSGVHLHEHAYGVIISWPAPGLVRTTVTAHLGGGDLADRAQISGIRSAMDTALTAVLREARLKAVSHKDGFVLVARPT
ncbi:hypothetical protein [Streptomyces sp. NPDC056632]|uniref:hypothetical protein n=1 Tax=Streptomyces sp. NPDC056632 TaxID=3345884 RepID=UPI00367464F1